MDGARMDEVNGPRVQPSIASNPHLSPETRDMHPSAPMPSLLRTPVPGRGATMTTVVYGARFLTSRIRRGLTTVLQLLTYLCYQVPELGVRDSMDHFRQHNGRPDDPRLGLSPADHDTHRKADPFDVWKQD